MNVIAVLLTNPYLDGRTGSELYVRDLAEELLCAGHVPLVYSPFLGTIANELRQRGICVVDDLDALPRAPDLIFGHHHFTSLSALLRFPKVGGIMICHSSVAWQDMPLRLPRLRHYVAVDEDCRQRLLRDGVPDAWIEVIFNGVDLRRFAARSPLPARPQRALVYSNYASEHTYLPAVRQACAASGIELDVVGAAAGHSSATPEALLSRYDLVFAKARSALEALAVGAAVVLCDRAGVGPLVTRANVEELRHWNFGRRTLRAPIQAQILLDRINQYDARDAASASAFVRAQAGRDKMTARLVETFRQALNDAATRPIDSEAEARAVAAYLRQLEPYIRRSEGDIGALETLLEWRERLQRLPGVSRVVAALASLARRLR